MVISLIQSDYCGKLFTQLGVGLCFGETDSWTLRVFLQNPVTSVAFIPPLHREGGVWGVYGGEDVLETE